MAESQESGGLFWTVQGRSIGFTLAQGHASPLSETEANTSGESQWEETENQDRVQDRGSSPRKTSPSSRCAGNKRLRPMTERCNGLGKEERLVCPSCPSCKRIFLQGDGCCDCEEGWIDSTVPHTPRQYKDYKKTAKYKRHMDELASKEK